MIDSVRNGGSEGDINQVIITSGDFISGRINDCSIYRTVSDAGISPDMRLTARCFPSPDDVEARFVTRFIVMVQDESFLNSKTIVLPWSRNELVTGCGTQDFVTDPMRTLAYEYLVPCVEECSTPMPSDQPTPYICEEPHQLSGAGLPMDASSMLAYKFLVPCVEVCGTETPSDQPTSPNETASIRIYRPLCRRM